MNFPLLIFLVSLATLMLATWAGDALRRKKRDASDEARSDSGLLLSAILTLLFLLIGFSFSMAINRYDLRKNCDQTEAIAIGTMYARADLLSPADAAGVHELLRKYVGLRVECYLTRSASRASEIEKATAKLQAELWSKVRPAIASVPPPLMGLIVSGVNDVANSQRATQAAWLNRIPLAAWALMVTISTGSCWLIGFRARRTDWLAFSVVPFAVSVSFFLMSDLDSPLGGAIRIAPQNLTSLSQSIQSR